MKKKIQLDIDIISESLCKTDKECYQQAIESLLYLSLETRSDISFAIVILSQFTVYSHEKHETALNQIFCYFRSTLDVDNSDANESLCETDKECFQQMIESLLYLSLETRSDISFVVVILS